MKAEYIVYTRTKNVDYKLIFSPSDSLCPTNVRKEFLTEIRGVINVERYESCLEAPVWFYSKKGNLVVFGIGVNNRELSEDCFKDFTGRSVRGFFGIIAREEDLDGLPFDILFFKDFYKQRMCPLWESDSLQAKQKGVLVTQDIKCYKIIKETTSFGINTDVNKTVIYPNSISVEKLISCAMACTDDVNAFGVVMTREHALDTDYHFMNCVVFDCEIKEEIQHEKITSNNNIWNNNYNQNNIEVGIDVQEKKIKTKKVVRLSFAAFLAVLALISIIILLKVLYKK